MRGIPRAPRAAAPSGIHTRCTRTCNAPHLFHTPCTATRVPPFGCHTGQHDAVLCQHPGTLTLAEKRRLRGGPDVQPAALDAQHRRGARRRAPAVQISAVRRPGAGRGVPRAAARRAPAATRSRSTPPRRSRRSRPARAGRPDRRARRAVLRRARTTARSAPVDALTALKLPVFAVLVDAAAAPPAGPAQPPAAGRDRRLRRAGDRVRARCATRLLPHLIDVCKNVEIAVGRRLPVLRTTVAAKLTRDAALNALKVSGASARDRQRAGRRRRFSARSSRPAT